MLVNLGMSATEYAQNWTNHQNGPAKAESLVTKWWLPSQLPWKSGGSVVKELVRKHEVRSEVRSETDVSERRKRVIEALSERWDALRHRINKAQV